MNKRNNDFKKVIWILGLALLWMLTLEVHVYFSTGLLLYAILLGAVFRGNNWFLGWNKSKEKLEKDGRE